MYLVHVHLQPHPRGEVMPDVAAAAIAGCGAGIEGFEHVSVHRGEEAAPVVGIYLRARCLEEAEAAAEFLWWRACASHPWLRDWRFRRAEVPLVESHFQPWTAE
ncbi:hypothetical protein [Streptomyces sp. NPDC046759]|uniref:hypothetical protein n=1 Tax=Streptomyces sp. NPDC046759 TaxID=3155019 RepID=UPI0033F011BC